MAIAAMVPLENGGRSWLPPHEKVTSFVCYSYYISKLCMKIFNVIVRVVFYLQVI